MAFTQGQLDALEEAIASGTLEVGTGDKKIRYQSLQDMIQIRNMMKQELTETTTSMKVSRSSFASFIKD